MALIKDYLKRRIFSYKTIAVYLIRSIFRKIIRNLPPPRQNLISIPACVYVKEKMKKYPIKMYDEGYLYPNVDINHVKKIKPKVPIVLFYGTLYRGRGVIDLLKACRILWKKGYVFKLHIYGWPVETLTKITIDEKLKNEKYIDHIVVAEKSVDIKLEVLMATMVVLPFRFPCSFQTPYTLIEPMAWGVPVITSDVGAFPNWVKDGQTGLICQKENPLDIAAKIEKILNDKSLAQKLAGNAQKLVHERLGGEDVLLKVLKSL